MTYYAMCFVCIVLWIGFKLIKRSKFVKPEEADLVWIRPEVAAHEAKDPAPLGLWEDIWLTITGRKKTKNGDVEMDDLAVESGSEGPIERK